MDRRTAVVLSLAALGSSAAFVLAAPFGAPADAAESTRVIDQDVDLAGARTLMIRSGSADLRIRPTLARRQGRPGESGAGGAPTARANAPAPAGSSAHVHAELRGTPEELAAAVHVSREGDQVTLTLDEPRPRQRGWTSIFSRSSWRSQTYEILLAADVDLTVRTGSGDVTVDAPPRGIRARTQSGNLAVTDARAAVEAQSASGNVSVNEPRGAVDAHTASGNLVVRGAVSSLELRTSSGNVSAALRAGWSGDAVRMESSSGNVRLAVPPGFRAALHTSTSSGRVTDAAHVAAAGSPVVSLRSSSGDVEIVTGGG